MSRQINKRIRRMGGLLLLFLLTAVLSMNAQAAKVKRLCYVTLSIQGGDDTQKIPVYEYRSKTKTTVAAKKALRTISLSDSVERLTVRISGKTSWFKKYYRAVSCPKEIAPGTTKVLRVRIKNKEGKLYRPAIRFRVIASDASPVPDTGQNGDGSQSEDGTQTAADARQNTEGTQTVADAGQNTEGTQTAADGGQNTEGTRTAADAGQNTEGTQSASDGAQTAASSDDWPWTVMLTGNASIDYVAEKICRKVLTPDMTQIQRAKALHDYIAATYSYGSISLWDSKKDLYNLSSKTHKKGIRSYSKKTASLIASGKAKKVLYDAYLYGPNAGLWMKIALEGMNNRIGDCYVIGNNYEVLCRHAGLSADILEHAAQGQSGHHYWNVVQIGKKYYMVDVDRPVQAGGDSLNYVFFLRGTKFMSKTAPYQTLNGSETYQPLVKKMSKTDCKGRI